jgi:putative endonuclease
MQYVYLIESTRWPRQRYVGQTHDLKARMLGHNSGNTPSTARYRPWRLVCYLGFADEMRAVAFERYLKTGSGHAFINRHFL